MKHMRNGEWTISHDPIATMDAHRRTAYRSVEECGCSYCNNFAAARELAYPEQFRALLNELRIPIDSETEVYEMGPLGNRRRSYAGWFHFIGVVEDGSFSESPIGDTFTYYFTNDVDLVDSRFAEGRPVAQLEFRTEIPWVIDLPEPLES